MVFTYGVVRPTSTGAPDSRASPTTASISCWARSGPSSRITASRASSHSRVSCGSVSRGITAMSVVLEVLGVVVANVRQVRQDHAQVVTECLFGGVTVVTGNRANHLLVLVDHFSDVARVRQAQPADAI